MTRVLMVVANNGFQDYEFGIPFDMLNKNGFDIDIAAGEKGDCVGVFGSKTIADYTISNVDPYNYDMVLFIGGGGAYSQYFHNKDYLNLAKKSKKIGAICITPMILSEAGIFNGINVTGWDQNGIQKTFIQDNGGFWLDKDVVVSGNIVTANGPDSAKEFANKCLQLLVD